MRRILCGLLALWFMMADTGGGAADQDNDRIGGALDARKGCAVVEAPGVFSGLPLTVECRARLEGKGEFNILVASEDKASATHWELFTTPKDGFFCAYLPGHKPNHARTRVDIADGRWHALAMVLEPDRVRLFVDGAKQTEEALSPPPAKGKKPGPLAFGALTTGGIGCAGWIDEVRISNAARAIDGVPEAEFVADRKTIGLWHLNEGEAGPFKDSSAAARPARWVKGGAAGPIIERMSTVYQPLPPAEDAAPLRVALKEVAVELHLDSIAGEAPRDAVLRQWSYDFAWQDKFEYPKNRHIWFQNKSEIRNEVLDLNALPDKADGGPAGAVLRRTGALIENLKKIGIEERIEAYARDWEKLRAAYAKERPAPGTARHKAYYLAACAVRRPIALANPLLDFDALLCVARGTFAGSVRSNPNTKDAQGGHFMTQYYGFNALPGGGLYIVKNFRTRPEIVNVVRDAVVENGRYKGRKLDHGAFATPDLSFDGKKIVFAWTANREHAWDYTPDKCWHIFTVGSDGLHLRQLTDGAWDDFDPCWLPNGRIAFVSERRGGYIRCFARTLMVRNYTLFSMTGAGEEIEPLSYFETGEWNPTVGNDGKLLYTRWDYTDRENCLGTRLWTSGPDGTDPRAPHGNYPRPWSTLAGHEPYAKLGGREIDSRFGAPLVEMGIRAVPNLQRFIFTAAPHHGEVFGSLCLLDLSRPDDGHMAQVRRITPDEPFPESEQNNRNHYKYGTPWPLSEDFYLCNVWEDLCLVDRFGNKELICELRALPCVQDERLRLIDPIPLRAAAAAGHCRQDASGWAAGVGGPGDDCGDERV